jgi:aspartate/methionine/tyrosine aminotransferase
MPLRSSQKAAQFQESVIREMTRLFLAHAAPGGVNLAQGFPDFPAPEALKEAACTAIRAEINQYAITWGAKSLREAIADKTERHYGTRPDPERELTVTCGATEAMLAALLALTDPGDEVIVFEPFYENYGPDATLSGAIPRFVRLHAPDWRLDPEELAAAFNNKTRAIIVNTPHNPTGKVFSSEELGWIAALCQKWDVAAITDEIYEHLVYEGAHQRLADLEGMAERTVTITGLSKTYSATGWRIGWLVAPPEATSAIRRVHDFLTVGAAAPLQEGAATALRFPDSYYSALTQSYREKRDGFMDVVRSVGLVAATPPGAYYILADATVWLERFALPDDRALAQWLVHQHGLAIVPGSSFFRNPADGAHLIRFCYCKKPETLARASQLLKQLA